MCFVVRIRPALASDAEPIAAVLRAAFTPYAALYTRAGLAATAVPPTEVQQRIREGPVVVGQGEPAITRAAPLAEPAP